MNNQKKSYTTNVISNVMPIVMRKHLLLNKINKEPEVKPPIPLVMRKRLLYEQAISK